MHCNGAYLSRSVAQRPAGAWYGIVQTFDTLLEQIKYFFTLLSVEFFTVFKAHFVGWQLVTGRKVGIAGCFGLASIPCLSSAEVSQYGATYSKMAQRIATWPTYDNSIQGEDREHTTEALHNGIELVSNGSVE